MNFHNVAFVWCGNSWTEIKNRPGIRPVCSVAAWPMVLECAVIGWDGDKPQTIPADKLRKYPVLLVNLFTGSPHISQIRAVHPDAFIIAMPDPYLELILYEDDRILEQMAQADAIGGRTPEDVTLWGTLLDKPAVWLPSPVGPAHAFKAFWNEPKEDALIATEHNGHPNSGMATVAALAAVQRRLDVPVHFYKASDRTKRAAGLAGLRVIWNDGTDYPRMTQAVARARWGIDLYGGHSQGRHLMTHAMAGTPVVGSCTNNETGALSVHPYRPDEAAAHVLANWDGPRYDMHRERAFNYVEGVYGFDASRERMQTTLERLYG